ncbi:hypothetical protein BJV82DRAFT_521218 [Fennellomyces sp. T-0311]|nr:hypothetical protein BJV82DRAFT_521218 [Fennellomyces sp. T-0311]
MSFWYPASQPRKVRPPKQLVADLMLPELDRQLTADPALWPNLKGLYVLNPVITKIKQTSRQPTEKVPVVKLQLEDADVLSFVAGGLTGVKAYMARRIKVRGDLVLAQRLEQLFEKAGGRERAIEFVQQNEHLLSLSSKL